jgi:hypothetical protein
MVMTGNQNDELRAKQDLIADRRRSLRARQAFRSVVSRPASFQVRQGAKYGEAAADYCGHLGVPVSRIRRTLARPTRG